ncbi:arylamine N-acetyltransferase family protein [Actinosynnema mirum]|uniref:N-acetyltransferase n=1 Tax=Actinosynnema mirum (strain ATCC 29888 / DSM 43827 / JCM 3225 / NBRC 14064 / NCIMB 13271 / NRRL B-12336 / IMRU 3971 / 101) TaxID=446462 RepID=C6W871_ACTMD|nr:arylamine N-acetyltransferase [Actinosynnema mirum]ACU37092.1 N-acetyltransferase [Actinosynnema mirum DSM 43827]
MYDTDTYLARLGVVATRPDRAALTALHRAHLRALHYDNTAAAAQGGPVPDNLADLDVDATFDRLVTAGRGGICFELNLLFHRLLTDLGYTTTVLSAGVADEEGGFSPDLAHRFTAVHLDGEVLLADVGFAGPSYLDPIRLAPDEQVQHGCAFRVVERDGRHLVLRRSRTTDWRPLYEFATTPRTLSDWDGFTPRLRRYLDRAVIAGTTLLCRAVDDGHRALVGKRHLVVRDGHETVTTLLDPAEHARVSAEIRTGVCTG